MAVLMVSCDVSPLSMIIFVLGLFCFRYDIIEVPWMSGNLMSSIMTRGFSCFSICLAFLPVLAVIVEYPSSSNIICSAFVMFWSLSMSNISLEFTC